MIKEDKQLLFKDLCMRLPYGVVVETQLVNAPRAKYPVLKVLQSNMLCDFMQTIENVIHKPYLRPMSSMTEEEMKEMHNLLSPEGTAVYKNDGIAIPINHYGEYVTYEFMNYIIQYLLENHFDFMGLVSKGLAIEVMEDNNPYGLF